MESGGQLKTCQYVKPVLCYLNVINTVVSKYQDKT